MDHVKKEVTAEQWAGFTFIEGDIRELATCQSACDGADYILHQAALGSVPRSLDDPITTNEVNINGFLNMLVACRDNKVPIFVYAASSSTYGDSKALPKVEENIGAPLSPYAVTKYVNELYAKVFADLYGLQVIGLRYFNVFGRRQDPEGAYAAAIPKFIRSFSKYVFPQIHCDGSQIRYFTYIENVIQANELAATATNPKAMGQVFNVAFGEEIILNDLVKLIREVLSGIDKKIATVEINYGPERIGDIKYSLASIDKAKSLLCYAPEYSMERGLRDAIKWYWKNK